MFKIGDTVELILDSWGGLVGDRGVVKGTQGTDFSVEFNESSKIYSKRLGHSCNGLCKEDSGMYISPYHMQKVEYDSLQDWVEKQR